MTFLMMLDSENKTDEITKKLRRINYPFNKLCVKNTIIIPIINNDYSVLSKEKFKSLLFGNKDFFKIISSGEYKIREIDFIEELDDETAQKIDELLNEEDYSALIKFIDENNLHIKILDIFDKKNKVLAIYDSGMIFTRGEIHDEEITKSIQEILSKIYR